MPQSLTTVRLNETSSTKEVELAINQAIGRTYRYDFRLAIGVFVGVPLSLMCFVGMIVGLGFHNKVLVEWCWVALMGSVLILTWLIGLMSHYETRRSCLKREFDTYRQTGNLQRILDWHLTVTFVDE